MDIDKSIFETKPLVVLVRISLFLLEKEFVWSNPYGKNLERNYDLLENLLKLFSESCSNIDLEFFCKFIEVNIDTIKEYSVSKNSSLLSNIVIPTASNYEVDYSVVGSAIVTENYKTEWSSYDELWVKSSIIDAESTGNFDWWSGNNIGTETDNFESERFYVDNIEEIGKDRIKESTLNKLDKKTLLELKRVIDNRLRLL